MDLADRLHAAMQYANLNQVQLAAEANVAQQTIHKILKRKQKTSSETVKLAMACKVRAEWLSEDLAKWLMACM